MAMAVRTDLPPILVLLRQTFVVSASLECPPSFFAVLLTHPIQDYVPRSVRFNNTNGIKHPYIIVIVLVAVAVLFPVIDTGRKYPAHAILLASDSLVFDQGK